MDAGNLLRCTTFSQGLSGMYNRCAGRELRTAKPNVIELALPMKSCLCRERKPAAKHGDPASPGAYAPRCAPEGDCEGPLFEAVSGTFNAFGGHCSAELLLSVMVAPNTGGKKLEVLDGCTRLGVPIEGMRLIPECGSLWRLSDAGSSVLLDAAGLRMFSSTGAGCIRRQRIGAQAFPARMRSIC